MNPTELILMHLRAVDSESFGRLAVYLKLQCQGIDELEVAGTIVKEVAEQLVLSGICEIEWHDKIKYLTLIREN